MIHAAYKKSLLLKPQIVHHQKTRDCSANSKDTIIPKQAQTCTELDSCSSPIQTLYVILYSMKLKKVKWQWQKKTKVKYASMVES